MIARNFHCEQKCLQSYGLFYPKLKKCSIDCDIDVDGGSPTLPGVQGLSAVDSLLFKPVTDGLANFSTIQHFLDDLCEKYDYSVNLNANSDHRLHCRKKGFSNEGRRLRYLEITHQGRPRPGKTIAVVGGLHGNQWLTVATVFHFLEYLLLDPIGKDLKTRFDWLLIPLANPDGFVYSHENETNYSKNRCPKSNDKQLCFGTDLNWNFDSNWGVGRVSFNESDEEFPGKSPVSEPETQALQDLISMYCENLEILAVFNLATYGGRIGIPYGTGSKVFNYKELYRIGKTMSAAMSGGLYQVGNTKMLEMRQRSGSLEDWVSEKTNVKYSFNIALVHGIDENNANETALKEDTKLHARDFWNGVKAIVGEMKGRTMVYKEMTIWTGFLPQF